MEVENPTSVVSNAKRYVGEFAADCSLVLRILQRKGIAYEGEFIRRKAGKTGK